MMNALTPASLGFEFLEQHHWRKEIRGRRIDFHELRTLPELELAERLQREVMKLTDEDMVHAPALLDACATGGFVLGAFEKTNALSVAFGFREKERSSVVLLSDFLAVIPVAQSLGIGFEMKRLQGVLALERGFRAVRWTVDPLRAANARLNFERLGALGIGYERNKYGANFGVGLYGGMPTDRLWLRWPLHSERTGERLREESIPHPAGSLDALEEVAARSIGAPQLVVSIPGDIDTLVQTDFERAMHFRMQTRDKIELAFEAGYVVSGSARSGDESRLLVEPAAMFEETEEQI